MSAEVFRHNFDSASLGDGMLLVGGTSESVDGISEIRVTVVARPPSDAAVSAQAQAFDGAVNARPLVTGWTAEITVPPGQFTDYQYVLLAGLALGSAPAEPVAVWPGVVQILPLAVRIP